MQVKYLEDIKMKNALMILGVLLISLSFVSAVCTVTMESESYKPSNTVTATMSCSEVAEKNTAYTLNWTYNGNFQLELDTGTTPAVADTPFFETYTINSSYSGSINATLQGTGLEGTDGAWVNGTNEDSLIIINPTFSPNAYIGELFSVDFTVTDENDKEVSGADCIIYATDNSSAPTQNCGITTTRNGHGTCSGILDAIHTEGDEYIARIRCSCGVGDNVCVDEDGEVVNSSAGSISVPFTVSSWLNVNTVTEKSSYIMKNELFVCANVTNVNYPSRIPIHIYHQVRCSSGVDWNNDTDRALIVGDNEKPDDRGINSGTTQMQCKRFRIPEAKYLQGRESQCYASTNVWVLNDIHEEIFGYYTTSNVFNITSTELNLYPDWEKMSDYKFQSIIDLDTDSFVDYNGTGVGQIDVKLRALEQLLRSYEQDIEPEIDFGGFIETEFIKNVTVYNSSGQVNDWALEILDDGSIEIEVRNQDISPTGWLNITLELNSFNERMASSNEEIANKTGIFLFEVNCPSEAITQEEIKCKIKSRIEKDQVLKKETDFTCWIWDHFNEKKYSQINFNKMITPNLTILDATMLVPGELITGEQYQVQCTATRYSVGSRTDSAEDTFTVTDAGWFSRRVDDVADIAKTLFKAPYLILIFFSIIGIYMVAKDAEKKYKKRKERLKQKTKGL